MINVFFRCCDIFTSFYRKSFSYFIFSLFLPSDLSSLENMLLCLVDYNSSFKCFLPFFSIYYYPIVNYYYNIQIHFLPNLDAKNMLNINSVLSILYYFLSIKIDFKEYIDCYKKIHLPSFNSTWFNFCHLFYEYSFLIFNILNIGYVYAIYAIKLKTTKLHKNKKFLIYRFALFFKQSTFKNYLLFICKSKILFIYFLLYVLWNHIYFLVYYVGVGNVNFMYWTVFVFICVFLVDMKCNLKC